MNFFKHGCKRSSDIQKHEVIVPLVHVQSAGAAEASLPSPEGSCVWRQTREHVTHIPAVVSVPSHAELSRRHEERGSTMSWVLSYVKNSFETLEPSGCFIQKWKPWFSIFSPLLSLVFSSCSAVWQSACVWTCRVSECGGSSTPNTYHSPGELDTCCLLEWNMEGKKQKFSFMQNLPIGYNWFRCVSFFILQLAVEPSTEILECPTAQGTTAVSKLKFSYAALLIIKLSVKQLAGFYLIRLNSALIFVVDCF